MPVTVTKIVGDIAQLNDYGAVVNAANNRLANGAGVTGALFRAAGPSKIAAEVVNIPADDGVKCPEGKARITGAGDLVAHNIPHIIHTVAPQVDMNKLTNKDYASLFSAYYSVLAVADFQGLDKIAWPLLGAGIYGWTAEVSMAMGLAAIAYYNRANPDSHLHVDFCLWAPARAKQNYLKDVFDNLADIDYLNPSDEIPDGQGMVNLWWCLQQPALPSLPSLPDLFIDVCDHASGADMVMQNPLYIDAHYQEEAAHADAFDVRWDPARRRGPDEDEDEDNFRRSAKAEIGPGGVFARAPEIVREEWSLWDCMNIVLGKYEDKYGQAKRDRIAGCPVFDVKLDEEQRVEAIYTFLEEGKGGYFSGDFAENGIRALIAWELYNNLGGKGVGLKSKQPALCGVLPKPEKGIRHNLRWETDTTRLMLLDALNAEYLAFVERPGFGN